MKAALSLQSNRIEFGSEQSDFTLSRPMAFGEASNFVISGQDAGINAVDGGNLVLKAGQGSKIKDTSNGGSIVLKPGGSHGSSGSSGSIIASVEMLYLIQLVKLFCGSTLHH